MDNTVELSSRLEFTLKDLGYEFPHYPVPEGENMISFLRERTGKVFGSVTAGPKLASEAAPIARLSGN